MYPGLCWVSLSGGSLSKTLQTVLSSDASLSQGRLCFQSYISDHGRRRERKNEKKKTGRKRLAVLFLLQHLLQGPVIRRPHQHRGRLAAELVHVLSPLGLQSPKGQRLVGKSFCLSF